MKSDPDWLNTWEAKRDMRLETVNPLPPPPPVSLREIVQDEVSRYLALHLARELTDRIMFHMAGK